MSVLGVFAATTDMVVSHMITMRMAIDSIIKYLSLWFLSKIKFMASSLIVVRGLGGKLPELPIKALSCCLRVAMSSLAVPMHEID